MNDGKTRQIWDCTSSRRIALLLRWRAGRVVRRFVVVRRTSYGRRPKFCVKPSCRRYARIAFIGGGYHC